ncbi:hypothetical protein Taro_040420, partial [Colocasia esculenta]|nr:hypothetical protein [Colocasia esculenta]
MPKKKRHAQSLSTVKPFLEGTSGSPSSVQSFSNCLLVVTMVGFSRRSWINGGHSVSVGMKSRLRDMAIYTHFGAPEFPQYHLPLRTYISYHGSVNTPTNGVDTGHQSLKQIHEDRVHCVDTVPGSVDTRPNLQKTHLPDLDKKSPVSLSSGFSKEAQRKGAKRKSLNESRKSTIQKVVALTAHSKSSEHSSSSSEHKSSNGSIRLVQKAPRQVPNSHHAKSHQKVPPSPHGKPPHMKRRFQEMHTCQDRVHSVDTVPGSVDTRPNLQKTHLPDWDSVSTQPVAGAHSYPVEVLGCIVGDVEEVVATVDMEVESDGIEVVDFADIEGIVGEAA